MPRDLTTEYNTVLSPEEEQQFQQFAAQWSRRKKKDLLLDLGDYDVRGWWKAGAKSDERGHGTDRYKKPSHPTFSDESIYHSKATPGGSRGEKRFTASPTTQQYWQRPELEKYMNRTEPGVDLVWKESPKAQRDNAAKRAVTDEESNEGRR